MKTGDKVTFNSDLVAHFIHETTNVSIEIDQYQKIVLRGVKEVGVILKIEDNMIFVSYPDGWEVPISNKFLLLLES